MSFSKRLGFTTEKSIQLNNIDEDLKNSIWNIFSLLMKDKFIDYPNYDVANSPTFSRYIKILWTEFFKMAIDDMPYSPDLCVKEVRSLFFKLIWYRIYDFIDFNIDALTSLNMSNEAGHFTERTNLILIRESSAYRIIDGKVSPISNDIEFNEISQTLENSTIKNVGVHIKSALALMSDRTNPNYRNSIKESISAVETLCREITGESTLGKAIKKFENSGVTFNQQFKNALEKLYAYTNDSDTGIRHALLDSGQVPDFDEAKFMLVSCSAFVNYLVSKRASN